MEGPKSVDMILYVNGDSHSAAGEAVNSYCWASDDSKYWYLTGEEKFRAHPDNLAVSYGKVVADALGYTLVNHATSAASNAKIFRTTYDYLKNNRPDLLIIGWTTWEREEWFNEDDGQYYQVNASGLDHVPFKWRERYKLFVINHQKNIAPKVIETHQKIFDLHLYLNELSIPHLFFNCHTTFYGWNEQLLPKFNWNNSYIDPYENFNYLDYLKEKGYKHSKYFHFGPDGHQKWAEFLLPHLQKLL